MHRDGEATMLASSDEKCVTQGGHTDITAGAMAIKYLQS